MSDAIDDDCCAMWALMLPSLLWMHTDTEPHLLLMPCLRGSDMSRVRVNYCPSCGVPRRGAMVSARRVVLPRACDESCCVGCNHA